MGGVMREYKKVVQTGEDSVNFYLRLWFTHPFLKRLYHELLIGEPYLVTTHFIFLILHLNLSLRVCLFSFIRVVFSSRVQSDCSSLRIICDSRCFKPGTYFFKSAAERKTFSRPYKPLTIVFSSLIIDYPDIFIILLQWLTRKALRRMARLRICFPRRTSVWWRNG